MACEIEFRWKSDKEEVLNSASKFVESIVKNIGGSAVCSLEGNEYKAIIKTDCSYWKEEILLSNKALQPPMPFYTNVKRDKN